MPLEQLEVRRAISPASSTTSAFKSCLRFFLKPTVIPCSRNSANFSRVSRILLETGLVASEIFFVFARKSRRWLHLVRLFHLSNKLWAEALFLSAQSSSTRQPDRIGACRGIKT